MSKKRRDRGESNSDLIGDLSQNELPNPTDEGATLTSFANAAYGSRVSPFPELDRGRIKVSLIPIQEITPDYAQPRRAIPWNIKHYWNGKSDSESMSYLFDKWLDEVSIERNGKPLEIGQMLRGLETERAPAKIDENQLPPTKPDIGTNESALLTVIALATSIYRDGLTNPITLVKRDSNAYMIETGERRWLAYQLLFWHFRDENWLKIPARVMENLSIWRQATENNARADLNAIAKARQLSLILMDLYTQQGHQFRPFEIYKTEQAFYAQVSDPLQFRVPYGKGELVLNAMGFEHKSSIKRYRDLLTLPPDVWFLADDANVPEGVLRQLVGLPLEQQLSWVNLWMDTGRLPQERGGEFSLQLEGHKLGKFKTFFRYELQQWEGEFENLDNESRQMVTQFLDRLLRLLRKM